MRTIEELAQIVDAERQILEGLASTGHLQEYAFVAFEQSALALLRGARDAGFPDRDVLHAAAPLFQDIISAAEAYGWPLCTETETALKSLRAAGISLRENVKRKPARPLSQAPREPPEFSIFVDESGSASFDETTQPVLCLAGAIIKDEVIPSFEHAADQLLTAHGLPVDTEFHAAEFLAAAPDGPLSGLDVDTRYQLLREFLAVGMQHVAGLHYHGMLKSMVKPAYRQKMLAQGLNPYTHTVVWFVVTLDRACWLITMPGVYKYFYDRTDAYRKDIGRIFRALAETPNKRLRLVGLKGTTPTSLESHESRCIQLADVAGYFLNRHRQLEIPAFKHRPELEKHRAKVFEMHEIVKPKIADYIGKDLHITVDWKALAGFTLTKQPKQPWRPPTGRRGR